MPLFTTTPMRMSRPIWAMKLKGVWVIHRKTATPTNANGSENMMENGWARLSKSEAMTK